MERSDLLKKIKEEVINLKASPLYQERFNGKFFPVIGEGNHFAEVMFIGEAPGLNEAKTGRPFCGTAGKVLDFCLSEIKIERKDVYITNIVKDRPPKNRDPSEEEIKIYSSFLDDQINIIKPKIIVTLGRFSAKYILEKFNLQEKIETITKMHGKVFLTDSNYGKLKIIVLMHPAVAIYQQSRKKELLDGFFVLKENLKNIKS